MSLFDLSKRRWLFCMTHPDDEISICAWMKRLADNGNEVYLSWTHSNSIREQEGRKVAEQLGIPSQNLFFHDASDAKVCVEFRDVLPKFQTMMAQVKPDIVACGAFEQGHVDHDTTNVLVNTTFKGDVLEIPFYHTYLTKLQRMNEFSDSAGQEVLQLNREEIQLKRNVAKQYKSQNIWKVLMWSEIWQLSKGRQISLSSREIMRLQGHKVFRIPNHPLALSTRLEKSETWQWWCDHVLPYIPS